MDKRPSFAVSVVFMVANGLAQKSSIRSLVCQAVSEDEALGGAIRKLQRDEPSLRESTITNFTVMPLIVDPPATFTEEALRVIERALGHAMSGDPCRIYSDALELVRAKL